MATDFFFSSSSSVIAGLFVASLGAVYAYTQLGTLGDTHTHDHTHDTRSDHVSKDPHAQNDGEIKSVASTSGTAQKGWKKKKKKGKGVRMGADEGEGEGHADANGSKRPNFEARTSVVVPGGFEGEHADLDVGVGTRADVVSREVSLAGPTASLLTNSRKARKAKQAKKKQTKGRGKVKGKAEDRDEDGHGDAEEDDEQGSETGKEAGVAHMAWHRPYSGNSTDASVSLPPSTSPSALASSRTVGKGLRAGTRLAPQPQAHSEARVRAPSYPRHRDIRPSPSLSLDTDSSWTRVDHRRLKMSDSIDGGTMPADSMDITSSDLTSAASDSPVAERMDSITTEVHGTREELVQRTLVQKPSPSSRKTGADDMPERSEVSALAHVVQVQPPMGETPIPGFSWEDYGDFAIQDGDSLLAHDADEEDEGEWGVVKSRRRNRTQLPQTTATASTSHAPAVQPSVTKKQRQNARKRELARSAKAEVEAARLEGLAKHKRELEHLRAVEESRSRI